MVDVTKNRALEKYIFGGLIGVLVGALVGRLVILAYEMTPVGLSALVVIGGWSGALVIHFATDRSASAFASLEQIARTFQAWCLRVVLWLLGAAALLGVVTVLSGSFDVVGRVAFTALATAFAAGGLWPTLSMIDKERHWRVGALGAAGVLAVYFLILPSIWEIGYGVEESWWVSLSILLTLPVGMVSMRLTHSAANRINGAIASVIYVTATYLYVTASWGSDWGSAFKLVHSGSIVLGYGALIVATLLVRESSTIPLTDTAVLLKRWPWRAVGVVAALTSACLILVGIWQFEILDPEWVANITIISAVVVYANVIGLVPLKKSQSLLPLASTTAAIVCGVACGITIVNAGPSQMVSVSGRVALAAGIVASTGLLGTLILAKLNRSAIRRISTGPITHIDAYCPCCGKRQAIQTGTAACAKCKTIFHFQVELPTLDEQPYTPALPTAMATKEQRDGNHVGVLQPEKAPMPFLDD